MDQASSIIHLVAMRESLRGLAAKNTAYDQDLQGWLGMLNPAEMMALNSYDTLVRVYQDGMPPPTRVPKQLH